MKIIAVHDPEDSQLDPIEPLGSISIQNQRGSELSDDCIWLDEWFEGLLSTLQGDGSEVRRIGLACEPDPLIWEPNNTGAILRYKNMELLIPSLTEFEEALRRAIIDFTEPYTSHRNWVRNGRLPTMREWALKTKAG